MGDLITQTRKANCADCGKEFDAAFWMIGQSEIVTPICQGCVDKRNTEAAADQVRSQSASREAEWQRICPAIYRDTNPADVRLDAKALRAALSWDPQSRRGLGLTGETGAGKTRCLFLSLRRAFEAGLSVAAVSHNRFSRIAQDALMGEKVDDARGQMRNFQNCRVLLFDDLGKAPRTERADAEIEELIEHRTSAGLPILWTANASGEWLVARFGQDRGPALVRRLAEFCDCIPL